MPEHATREGCKAGRRRVTREIRKEICDLSPGRLQGETLASNVPTGERSEVFGHQKHNWLSVLSSDTVPEATDRVNWRGVTLICTATQRRSGKGGR